MGVDVEAVNPLDVREAVTLTWTTSRGTVLDWSLDAIARKAA
jgi:hypothetical protein